MRELGTEEARRRLPELLDRAHAGEASIIKKRGVPYAALVPLDRRLHEKRGVSLIDLIGSGAGLWGDDVARTIADYRDEWT